MAAPTNPPRLPYLPGLDGLRALALLVVLAFHADVGFVHGGYLPLTAFFVLSGFLITSLLLVEHRRDGSIDLGAFWGRRVRRLVPAAMLGLGIAAAFVAFGARSRVPGITGDVVSALTWSTNWRFILSERPYVDAFADPSPLQHYWSLAVEEQFYLALPLLAAASLWLGRGRRWVLAASAVALIAASTLAMIAVHRPGEAPLRAYFGTDTRAAELLVGVLLALVMITPQGSLRQLHGRTRRLVGAAGASALAASVWLWCVTPEFDDRLYTGGLLGIAVLAALVVTAATQDGTIVSRLLGTRPLVETGRISYGIYLFHWPLFLWLDGARTGLGVAPLFGLRLAVVVPLAWLSYRLVEHPLRFARWEPRVASVACANAAVAAVAITAVTATMVPPPLVSLTATEREQALAGVVATAAPTTARAEGGDSSPQTAPTSTLPLAAQASGTRSRQPPSIDPEPPRPASPPTDGPSTTLPSATSTPPVTAPAAQEPIRVLVVGDSLAFNVATGLLRLQHQGAPILVQDASIPGCTVTRGGTRRIRVGTWRVDPKCHWWDSEGRALAEAFDPDVVLVNSYVNEIFDRSHPKWNDVFKPPGDPVFDGFIVDEYALLTEIFGSSGATVVWLTPICVDFSRYLPTYIEPTEGDRRVAYFRDVLHRALVDGEQVAVVDANDQVCPGGEYTTAPFGIEGGRVDGFHFSDEAAEELARRVVLPAVVRLVPS